ncbi:MULTISPECIES: hypothetical protein [Elizabethkingia]|uniref:hypothetical protein n=1 Tax=Elizabethkingia TaxID=308865 RepID=UPI0021A8285C|nr:MULTISPECIES: hypothetical protein [Elizabethkingia]MCT3689553.1 hypothetical protein [Elizabethkingia anophelis]MCT3706359.1 hypothetical protein [Elizabethkingia anophelis]MCT3713377.1 hypothetical protein [Elizabethkingia anophelis]MCT3716795.1 hypothetical protein [Elizabethkingia anophelis]MCT3730446.1 hypothetical protein [Elizabethkingia anophelis]
MENKLIPMTEFTLQKCKFLEIESNDDLKLNMESHFALLSIRRYAQFLKQPLALWMFVSINSKGEIAQRPEWKNNKGGELQFEYENKEYEEAKSRVLFEGFKLLSDYNGMYRLRNAQNVDITFDSHGCYAEPFDSIPGKRINTIEEITYLDLTLTETVKQIYGS